MGGATYDRDKDGAARFVLGDPARFSCASLHVRSSGNTVSATADPVRGCGSDVVAVRVTLQSDHGSSDDDDKSSHNGQYRKYAVTLALKNATTLFDFGLPLAVVANVANLTAISPTHVSSRDPLAIGVSADGVTDATHPMAGQPYWLVAQQSDDDDDATAAALLGPGATSGLTTITVGVNPSVHEFSIPLGFHLGTYLYRGYALAATGSASLPAVALRKDGATIGLTSSAPGAIDGIVLNTPSGVPLRIWVGSDGRPSKAVISDNVVLYAQWTNTNVNVAVIHGDRILIKRAVALASAAVSTAASSGVVEWNAGNNFIADALLCGTGLFTGNTSTLSWSGAQAAGYGCTQTVPTLLVTQGDAALWFGTSAGALATAFNCSASVSNVAAGGQCVSKVVTFLTARSLATLLYYNLLAPVVEQARTQLGSSTSSQLAITTQPSGSDQSGAAFAQQPVVQLRDAAGNAVAQAGVVVTAAIASGGGTLGGSTSATTNASGVATFTNLSITGLVGNRTLSFSAQGLTAATSATITLTAGASARLTITTQPPATVQSDVVFAQQASVQVSDAAGNPVAQAGVVVTASVPSGGTLLGTATATTNASGVATFTNLAISGTGVAGVRTLTFAAPSLTSATSSAINLTYATPDLLNNASFETDWNGFTNWAGNGLPIGVTRATDVAYQGQFSMEETWTPNATDFGSETLFSLSSPQDRVWVRFYFRLTAPISTIMKFVRFYDPSFTTPMGGFFLASDNSAICQGIVCVGSDQENGAITTPIGLTQAQVADGNWHSLEIDYWRNGDPSGFPSQAFWFDGKPVTLPDGTASVQFAGAGNASFWLGGRLYSGQRNTSVQLGTIEWLSTLNAGNTSTGQVNLDYIAISSRGRIGP